jgi:hypothetical protein
MSIVDGLDSSWLSHSPQEGINSPYGLQDFEIVWSRLYPFLERCGYSIKLDRYKPDWVGSWVGRRNVKPERCPDCRPWNVSDHFLRNSLSIKPDSLLATREEYYTGKQKFRHNASHPQGSNQSRRALNT